MSIGRVTFWVIALLKNLASVGGVMAFLSSFGALWLIVEIANYFQLFPTSQLQASWEWFLFLGVALAVWRCRPTTLVKCQLSARDVTIEIRIGDFFKQPGDFIVGTNTTFDTRISPNLISEQSLQGQLTRKFYPSDHDFDIAVETSLNGVESTMLASPRAGKNREYNMGTTIQVRVKDGAADRSVYLVAMARMNEFGNARTTMEDLKNAMARLWLFVSERATKGVLVAPVLGSRFGRLPQREEIVREMIKSFVAASAESSFCEKLTIVLHPNDVVDNNMDLHALGDYLRHICRYTKLENRQTEETIGTPVSEVSATPARESHPS